MFKAKWFRRGYNSFLISRSQLLTSWICCFFISEGAQTNKSSTVALLFVEIKLHPLLPISTIIWKKQQQEVGLLPLMCKQRQSENQHCCGTAPCGLFGALQSEIFFIPEPWRKTWDIRKWIAGYLVEMGCTCPKVIVRFKCCSKINRKDLFSFAMTNRNSD